MDGARNPNLTLLADLICRAKGPARTLREFSGEVGVSPATMSRIMNGKISRPLSSSLLSEIAADADPESKVSLDMLLKANNGEETNTQALQGFQKERLNFEVAERKAVIDSLIWRGYTIKGYLNGREVFFESNSVFRMYCDFEIETDALDQCKDTFERWAFECKHLRDARDGMKYRQWISNFMSAFYCGATDAKRISLVIDEKRAYKNIKKELEKIRVPDEISVILVADGEVEEEYIIPTTGPTPKEVFFRLPEQSAETKPDEDDWDS